MELKVLWIPEERPPAYSRAAGGQGTLPTFRGSGKDHGLGDHERGQRETNLHSAPTQSRVSEMRLRTSLKEATGDGSVANQKGSIASAATALGWLGG